MDFTLKTLYTLIWLLLITIIIIVMIIIVINDNTIVDDCDLNIFSPMFILLDFTFFIGLLFHSNRSQLNHHHHPLTPSCHHCWCYHYHPSRNYNKLYHREKKIHRDLEGKSIMRTWFYHHHDNIVETEPQINQIGENKKHR